MFLVALFTMTKTWKQTKCPLANKQTKEQYLHTMEYYSAIKNNEIMSFATTWIDLEGMMLTEISQIGKEKYYMMSFLCEF